MELAQQVRIVVELILCEYQQTGDLVHMLLE
jgi:hypothetical protein